MPAGAILKLGAPIVCQFALTVRELRPSPVLSDTSIALLAPVQRADVRFPHLRPGADGDRIVVMRIRDRTAGGS